MKLTVRLDGEHWCTAFFQVSPEMFDQVKVQALAGPLKDIYRLALKPLLHCFGCALRVIVLLEGKPSPQSEVLSTLGAGSYQGSLCTLHHASYPWSWLVFQFLPLKKHLHSIMLPPPCFTVEMGLARWWEVPGFPPDMTLGIQAKEINLGSLIVWETFRCLLENSKWACHVPFTEEWLPSNHKGLIGGVSFWKVLPSPQRNSGALSEWPLGSWSPPWPRPLSPQLLSLARWPALRRVLVDPNLFHLRTEVTVFFGTFNAAEMFF